MIGAGILGGPGIGYKQDYFAVQNLTEHSPSTYERYKAQDPSGFPLLTSVIPDRLPPVAGLDNSKLKVFDDFSAYSAKGEQAKKEGKTPPSGPSTTLDADLKTIHEQQAAGKPVGPKLVEDLTNLRKWWEKEGLPNFEEDKKPLGEARLFGAKTALLYTAFVPAGLAIGFMILIVYFMLSGGYKQVHLAEEQPMGEY
jgi:hypothetical protein